MFLPSQDAKILLQGGSTGEIKVSIFITKDGHILCLYRMEIIKILLIL